MNIEYEGAAADTEKRALQQQLTNVKRQLDRSGQLPSAPSAASNRRAAEGPSVLLGGDLWTPKEAQLLSRCNARCKLPWSSSEIAVE